MGSKEVIFEALRRSKVGKTAMPSLDALESSALCFDNPVEAFCESLTAAGGKVLKAAEVEELADSFTVKGQFGVAENGAVWIGEGSFEDRRDLFIHDRLVILLDSRNIVSNMHQAYARLGEEAGGYGIFISGPSKTADIEQALVFGAHGPRELVVVLK